MSTTAQNTQCSAALAIEAMAYGGSGVAHTAEGKAVFVSGAVVGDVVRPLTLKQQSTYDRCESFELVEPSLARVPARCPHATVCDGCPWQTLAYAEQLHWKRRAVVDALTRIAALAPSSAEALTAACVPAPEQWHYRNKVELSAFKQGGKPGLGLLKKQSHEHIRLNECLLMPQGLTTLPKELGGSLGYALKDSFASLSRVAVRASTKTGSTEVALYMAPSKVNRGLLAKVVATTGASATRVIISGNSAERKVKQVEVLAGKGFWTETLAGFTYRISAPSFFQINTASAELMIAHVEGILDSLALPQTAHVADLYCGAGTFTLMLAQRFERVSAVESYGSSIRDLRRNLEANGFDYEDGGAHSASTAGWQGVRVIGGDAARELPALEPLELALIDPPRSGLRPEAVGALLKARPRHLVYVSCNPATQARDLRLLMEGGYQLRGLQPFDQFPQSYHVELIALLSWE